MLCLKLGKELSQSPIPLISLHLGNQRSFDKCLRSDNGLSDRRNSRVSIQRSSNGSNKCNNRHNNRRINRISNRHNNNKNIKINVSDQLPWASCSKGQNRECRWNSRPKGMTMCDH